MRQRRVRKQDGQNAIDNVEETEVGKLRRNGGKICLKLMHIPMWEKGLRLDRAAGCGKDGYYRCG